jgi:2-polyprenyl-3-methyl-5-hydroxy-6-metoxy-1,4-benzoquinol methylase
MTTFDIVQHLADATTGTLELYAVHLGRELGLYEALDRQGPATPTELADRAGIHPRYAREWLEQQAVAGFLTVEADHTDPDRRLFVLPDEHRGALVDPIDPDHVSPFAHAVVGIGATLDQVVDAYRTGGGVTFEDFGPHMRHGQGGINRPAFTTDLVKAWLPAVAGVADRLAGGGRVLDVGCGVGWSTIAVKAAWPAATVIGIDTDAPSIVDARANAEQAGVEVELVDGTGPGIAELGHADVVIILEALHDMSDPVGVLTEVHAALAPGGIVVIADEAVGEAFTAPGDDLERMMYGWSVNHCLPAAMAEQPSAALGTVLRPGTVAELATAAGFTACEVVDVDAGFFRIYRLTA